MLVGGKVGNKYFTVYLGTYGELYVSLGNNLVIGSTDFLVSSRTRQGVLNLNTLNKIRICASSIGIDVFVGDKLEALTGENGLLRGNYDVLTFGTVERPIVGKMLYNIIYNRQLTPTEIAHNFSVLNNSDAIKSLEATDSEANKTNLLFSSDTDHVTTPTGHTDEERYTELAKSMSKEFTSANGADISVANGIGKQRVLGMETTGQTVKNICLAQARKTLDSVSRFCALTNSEITGSSYHLRVKVDNVTSGITELRVLYTLINGAEGVYGTPFNLTGVGVYELDLNINNLKLINNIHIPASTAVGESITISGITIVENTDKNKLQPKQVLSFGLTSTTATVSNNSVKYQFYKSLEDKANNKPIVLPFAEDKFTLNSDGSCVYVDASDDIILNENTAWQLYAESVGDGYTTCVTTIPIVTNSLTQNAIIDKLSYHKGVWDLSSEGHATSGAFANRIFVKLKTAQKNNISEFIQRLVELGGLKCIYKSTTPTTYTVDKSINQAIATYDKTNVFRVGDSVKPASFKITVPVDERAAQQAEIDQIKQQLGALAALQLAQIN